MSEVKCSWRNSPTNRLNVAVGDGTNRGGTNFKPVTRYHNARHSRGRAKPHTPIRTPALRPAGGASFVLISGVGIGTEDHFAVGVVLAASACRRKLRSKTSV